MWRRHYGDSGGPSRFSQFPQPPSGTLKNVRLTIPGEWAMNPVKFLHFLLEIFPVDADVTFIVAESLNNVQPDSYYTMSEYHQGACEAVAFARWIMESHQAIVLELRASYSLQEARS